MQFALHSHPPCGEHCSTIDDDFVFEICQRKNDRTSSDAVFFGLQVLDLAMAIEKASALGGSIIRDPDFGTHFSFYVFRLVCGWDLSPASESLPTR